MELHRSTVREIPHLGGTILGPTNRGILAVAWLSIPMEAKRRLTVPIRCFSGSAITTSTLLLPSVQTAASPSPINCKKRSPRCGVPKTIDNDLESTTLTFGFNTAVSFATECIDRLHSTLSPPHYGGRSYG